MTTSAGDDRLVLPDVAGYWARGRARSLPVVASTAGPLRSAPVTRGAPRVALLVPRTDIGGGARILFEHANRLQDEGWVVRTYSYWPAPAWFELRVPHTQVGTGGDLISAVEPCDVVLCGYWDQVGSAGAAQVAPVVHFEQGDYHLFEDLSPEVLALIGSVLGQADVTVTVSSQVERILAGRYATPSSVIPNAIDPAVFRPDGPVDAVRPARRYLMCVGWDGNDFKGMDEVRVVVETLEQTHPDVDLVWVTPKPPREPMGRVVVGPSQTELASLYRGAQVYLCASRYESFPLPPLEAMACGTPVVSTRNPGSLEYLRDGENAALVDIGDASAMHAAVTRLLDDEQARAQLTRGGLRTAASYEWAAISASMRRTLRAATTVGAGPTVVAWHDVGIDGVEPAVPSADALLQHVLGRTGAAEVMVPVSRPSFEGHCVVRWEVVARNDCGVGVVRVRAPHRAQGPAVGGGHWDGVNRLLAGDAREGLAALHRSWRDTSEEAVRGALGRWIALALHELGDSEAALDVLRDGMATFPDNADYVYLAGVVGQSLGMDVHAGHGRALVRAVGDAVRYADWFDDVEGLWVSAFGP